MLAVGRRAALRQQQLLRGRIWPSQLIATSRPVTTGGRSTWPRQKKTKGAAAISSVDRSSSCHFPQGHRSVLRALAAMPSSTQCLSTGRLQASAAAAETVATVREVPVKGGTVALPVVSIRNRGARQLTTRSGSGEATPEEDPVVVVKDGTESYVVAARDLEHGDVVFHRSGGWVSREKTRHSVQVGAELHIAVDDLLRLTNHSCAPNCQIHVVEASTDEGPYLRITVRAPRLAEGEMITIDYNAMEIEMTSPFDCACGAPNCRKRIAGFSKLPRATQEEYVNGAWSDPTRVSAGDMPPPPLTATVRDWVKANL